jgi:tryptophan synthase alpha chain
MPITFQKKPSLIAYITCGDPDLATSCKVAMACVDAGVSVIELGVPFSDPVADGPVIQRASDRALGHGTSLQDVFEIARDIRKLSQVGLIIFSYLNPILKFGFKAFAETCKGTGLDGALVTDLPLEEAHEYLNQMRPRGLSTIFLAAPTSTDRRLKQIVQASTGFVYAVARTGVTGARQQMPEDAQKLVARIRKISDLPVAVGFGISTAEQVAAVSGFADAAVVGSAIVQTIEQNPGKEAASVAKFIEQLSAVRRQRSAI